ncbi:helix-turn-helix transcriptional regulator [Serratia sp. AKBS12]|uniref:S24 family peptidase n=1 Tax=Serratia sp. AKBS12 TaxID=2974597 RepID=UPI0021661CA6|nr:helix-turn-helix transcriptional regulator [Serratia sp. AKBS12]MCS3407937.1 helix-turn-helix transcriptional regulator [Serratia sp. AKBS12]HEI8866369.1 helix-turn-helix transcriptional regulator [Serratia odorifera]
MEIKEIRRNNLRDLMARYARNGINQHEFSRLVESSAPTLSQITGDKSCRNLGDNLARRIEARLSLPTGWLDVFHEKLLAKPFDNVAAESDFQPARLKPVVWEETEQDREEFVEIPLLDIDFSAGDGCYDIVDLEAFSLIFRRYYLHKMGVPVNAARIIRISGSSMEPRLQDGDVVGINTDDTRIREGKTYAIRHGNLLRVKILIEQPDGGVIIRSLNREEYQDEQLSYQQRKEQLIVLGRVFWSSSSW